MNSNFDSRTASLLLVAVGWALCLALIGSPEVLLFTAPVFLLAAPLALGRYIGEELVEVIGSRVRRRRVKSTRAVSAASRTPRVSIDGSLLIASNLAGRAPPSAFV